MEITFDKMMDFCKTKKELRAKEEIVDGVPVTIFSYMVAFIDTFDEEIALEFRGTTFRNDTKECICRPFKKFFNINERAETQEDKLDLSEAFYFTKFDGSMATPVLINDKIFWKTKKSFSSDVAIKIQKYYDETHQHEHLIKNHLLMNTTPIFEYVSPNNRIVLEYKKEELILLGFRCNDTGLYIPNFENTVDINSFHDIYEMKGIEGFVICYFDNMVKCKTSEYMQNHRIVTQFNPKEVIKSVLNETIDDILAVVYQLGMSDRAKEIENIRDKVLTYKLNLMEQVNSYFDEVKELKNDAKEYALMVQKSFDNEYHKFLYAMRTGKDITKIINECVFEKVYVEYKNVEEID